MQHFLTDMGILSDISVNKTLHRKIKIKYLVTLKI